RTIADATGQRRVTPSRSTPRPAISASAVSNGKLGATRETASRFFAATRIRPTAVVTTPPSSCSVIYAGDSPKIDCGGAFYARVANGYQVIPAPIGSTVTRLPNGAVSENIEGVAYFRFGDAYYRPFCSGSSVIYEVVAKPG